MKIKLLSKDQCLKISKILNPNEENENELLFYLPDHVFSRTFEVQGITDYFLVYEDDPYYGVTEIPPFFVDEVHK